MTGQAIWEGIEVEGRLSGLRTLFLRGVPADFSVLDSYPHVFVDHETDFSHEQWSALAEHLVTRYRGIVTLSILAAQLARAAETHGHALLNRSHIMVVIELPATPVLKLTDTVKVHTAPFYSRSFVWGQGLLTTPEHYTGDKTL